MRNTAGESLEPDGTSEIPVEALTAQGTAAPLSAPTISSISPSCGPVAGGTAVTISGTGLSTTTSVRFGTVRASFSVQSDTTLAAVAPAGTSGCVRVSVTTPAGTATSSYLYGCLPPTVTSLCPNQDAICGGSEVTVIGTNLTGATSVTFGGKGGTGVVVDPSGNSLTVMTPPNSANTYEVRVTTPSGTSVTGAGSRFTYVCPRLYEMFPACGPMRGGNTVCVTGANLNCLREVSFNGSIIGREDLQVHSSGTFLTLTAPWSSSPGTIAAHGIAMVNAFPPVLCRTGAVEYTYYPPTCPTVIRMTPVTGPDVGGTPFQIYGNDLYCTTVTIDGVDVPVSTDPYGQCLTGITPPHAPGYASVAVSRIDCEPAYILGGFTYTPFALPQPTYMTPLSGPTTGGNAFLITGANLNGATVNFGPVSAINVIVDASGTSLTGIVPAGSGAVPVSVTTASGSATLAEWYTYVAT